MLCRFFNKFQYISKKIVPEIHDSFQSIGNPSRRAHKICIETLLRKHDDIYIPDPIEEKKKKRVLLGATRQRSYRPANRETGKQENTAPGSET